MRARERARDLVAASGHSRTIDAPRGRDAHSARASLRSTKARWSVASVTSAPSVPGASHRRSAATSRVRGRGSVGDHPCADASAWASTTLPTRSSLQPLYSLVSTRFSERARFLGRATDTLMDRNSAPAATRPQKPLWSRTARSTIRCSRSCGSPFLDVATVSITAPSDRLQRATAACGLMAVNCTSTG